MLEIAAIAAVVFLVLAVYLFLENNKLRHHVVELDAAAKNTKRTGSAPATVETKSQVKANKASKAEKKAASATAVSEKEMDEAKSEIKDLKKQLYDLRSENKDLRKQSKDADGAKPRGADSDVVFQLRQEIAELKGEISRLETEGRSARPARSEPKPEPAPAPAAGEPRPQSSEGARVADPAELRDLRAKLEAEMETVRREARKEVGDAESRLKKTAANVDKQRRRADNNDRAYKITQRQLDATQERVELLEAELKKAGFASSAPAPEPVRAPRPAPKKVEPPAAAEAEAPEAVETPEAVAPEPAQTEAPTAAVLRRPGRREGSEASDASETAEKPQSPVGSSTTILSSAALARSVTEDVPEAALAVPAEEVETVEAPRTVEPAKPVEADRPSSEFFGMPGFALEDEEDSAAQDADPGRSTQFAFPAHQQAAPDETPAPDTTNKFAPVTEGELQKGVEGQTATREDADADRGHTAVLTSSKLASFSVDDPETMDKIPAPQEGSTDALGGKRLGEQLSEIDDAWADLDID